MRDVNNRKDRGVSEVIGTMFIFAAVISILTTVVTWYVPAAQTAAEEAYQSNSLAAMATLTSEMSNPYLATGSLVNQNIPLGIQGSFIIPASTTSLSYSSTGYTGSLQYGIGLGFSYQNAHPTSAVLNKIVGTYPTQSLVGAGAECYVPSVGNNPPYLYIAGNDSSNVAVVNANTGNLVTYIYAGGNPDSLVYDPVDHLLFVSDFQSYTSTTTYSTVSVISTSTNQYIESFQLPFTNPTSITYGQDASGIGHVYVASSLKPNIAELAIINGGANLSLVSQSTSAGSGHSQIAFYASGHQLVALTTTAGTYYVLAGNLGSPTSYTIPSSSPVGYNAKLLDFCIVGSNMYISYAAVGASPAGVLCLAVGTTTATLSEGYYNTFPSGTLPGNITFDSSTNLLGVVLQGKGSTSDQIYLFSTNGILLGLTNAFVYESYVTVDKRAMDIVYADSISYGTGQTGNFYFVSSTNLNEESQLLINSGLLPTYSISIYQHILDNFYQNPSYAAFNIHNNYLYVSNYGSGTISVISPINNSLLARISLGPSSHPTGMAVDSRNGLIYVVESTNASIAVISNFALLGTIPVPVVGTTFQPFSIAFDNNTNKIYYTANGGLSGASNGLVYAIDPTNNATSTVVSSFSGKATSLAFNSFNNQTYFVEFSQTLASFEMVSLETAKVTPLQQTNSAGLYTIVFDSYNGYLYAAFSLPSKPGLIEIYSLIGSAYSLLNSIATGGEPLGPVFDAGNNLVYIPDSAPNNGDFATAGSNVTIIDATKNSYISTIWTGDGAEYGAFDPNNGYVYVPDNSTSKVTVIDGGFTVFNNKPGVLVQQNLNMGGSISTSGQTNYVTPVDYIMESGSLIENFTSNNQTKVIGDLPIQLTVNSGNIYFSATAINMARTSNAVSSSIASTSSTALQLQVLSEVNSLYYLGYKFYISDLYGNQYPAVVTNVVIEYFTMSFNTPFAKVLDNSLFEKFNGSGSSAPTVGTWEFNLNDKSYPFYVTLNNNHLSITLPPSDRLGLESTSLIYYDVGLNSL